MVMDWRCTKHPALMMRDQPANMWFYLTSKLRPWMCERQVPVPSNGMVQPWKSKHFRPQTLNLKFWRVSTFKMNGFRSATWTLLRSAEVPQHHRPSPRARWQASANVLWAAWSRRNAMRKPTRLESSPRCCPATSSKFHGPMEMKATRSLSQDHGFAWEIKGFLWTFPYKPNHWWWGDGCGCVLLMNIKWIYLFFWIDVTAKNKGVATEKMDPRDPGNSNRYIKHVSFLDSTGQLRVSNWVITEQHPEATMLIARLAQVDYGTSAKIWEDNRSETNWEHIDS